MIGFKLQGTFERFHGTLVVIDLATGAVGGSEPVTGVGGDGPQ